MMNFATRAGWRYYRNTWITATVMTFALAASCSVAPRPAFAGPDPSPPVAESGLQGYFGVVIFTDAAGKIQRAIPTSQTDTVDACGEALLSSLVQHQDELEKLVDSGLTARAVCFDTSKGVIALTLSQKNPNKDEARDPRLAPEQAELPRTGA